MTTDTVGRLSVSWRPDTDPPPAARDRLDGLVRALVDHGFPDGLAAGTAPGVEVCVRQVVPPVHHMRWDADDAELVAEWGRAVEEAVDAAAAAGGGDVVRYRSRAVARQELVVAVLRRNRDREWAWRLLDLWPVVRDDDPESLLRSVLLAVGLDEPEAVVGLLVSICEAGLLHRLTTSAGEDLLVALIGTAWQAAGGDPVAIRPGIVGTALGTGPRDADGSVPARAPAPVAELVEVVARRSVIVRALEGTSDPGPVPVVRALAAAGVLEVEPALAGSPSAGTVAAMLATRITAGARPGSRAGSPGGVDDPRRRPVASPGTSRLWTARPTGPAGPALDDEEDPPGAPGRPDIPADGEHEERAAPDDLVPRPAEHPASTAWGGLLFLLPLVAALDLPARVAAAPELFGPGLRPVLHGMARRLVARAAANLDPAEPRDPAVLAFAGLPPTADPPEVPASAQLEPEVDALVTTLASWLGRSVAGPAAERDLLATVCRRRAVIEADPGWIDVLLNLDEVDVDVRRAGLDLDPGHVSWLGVVVRFRYG